MPVQTFWLFAFDDWIQCTKAGFEYEDCIDAKVTNVYEVIENPPETVNVNKYKNSLFTFTM